MTTTEILQPSILQQEVKSEPPRDHLTPEQRTWFEDFCIKLRSERDEMLAIANEFSHDRKYATLADVPQDLMRDAKAEYNERHNLPAPFWVTNEPVVSGPSQPKQFKPLKMWSKERRWRKHLADLNKRVRKAYSLPEFICDRLQDEVLQRPDYYGVCPLPGAVDVCPVQLSDFKKLAAVEYENQLRAIEAGVIQPLVPLPLALKDKDLELVELQPVFEVRLQRMGE